MKTFIKKIFLQSIQNIGLKNKINLFKLLSQSIIDETNEALSLKSLLSTLQEPSVQAENKLRKVESNEIEIPTKFNHNKIPLLKQFVRQENAPWKSLETKEYSIPTMISHEEKQYYNYIGQFYSGQGEIIEIGPWLGASTHYIVDGLLNNPNFASKKLHVFDDFIWRSSWMDEYLPPNERPVNHGDFQPLFNKYLSDVQQYIQVTKGKIAEHDGNQDIPQIIWNNGLVELLYIDCGRDFEINEDWYKIFSPYFIPNITLLIMQDWGLHKELPFRWYNQTKQFTESKGNKLQIIHELTAGNIATFLYKD